MKLVISPNLQKQDAYQTARAVCQLFYPDVMAGSVQLLMDESLRQHFDTLPYLQFLPQEILMCQADFAIAIGGDGTILRCANAIFGTSVKLVGINTGRLGFLAAIEAGELYILRQLLTGQYAISHRMMLQTTICGGSADGTQHYALNDVYVSRSGDTLCDFSVFADDMLIGTYRADGIILSTPTGSTAYALSAGGPVMEPDLELIEMNLICPHSLFARPMLFAPQRKIRITYSASHVDELLVHVDGTGIAALTQGQSIVITRAEQTTPFVDFKGTAFYDALNGKLMQPLKGFDLPERERMP